MHMLLIQADYCTRLCSLFLIVIVFISLPLLAELGVDLIEQCCVLGSGWAGLTRGACTAYPEELLENVDGEDAAICISLANICCTQTFRHKQCMAGRDIFVSTSTCSNIRVVRGNTEVYTHQRVSHVNL